MPSLGRVARSGRAALRVDLRGWSSPMQTQRAPGAAVPRPVEALPTTAPSPCIPEGASPRVG